VSAPLNLAILSGSALTLNPTSAQAGQRVTITGSGFGATQGTGYVRLVDNFVGWGGPGDGATFLVNTWSDTSITFTVPTPSGPNGQWAVTPGTTATVTVTNPSGVVSAPLNLAIQ
jgi:hypothetical protein